MVWDASEVAKALQRKRCHRCWLLLVPAQKKHLCGETLTCRVRLVVLVHWDSLQHQSLKGHVRWRIHSPEDSVRSWELIICSRGDGDGVKGRL